MCMLAQPVVDQPSGDAQLFGQLRQVVAVKPRHVLQLFALHVYLSAYSAVKPTISPQG